MMKSEEVNTLTLEGTTEHSPAERLKTDLLNHLHRNQKIAALVGAALGCWAGGKHLLIGNWVPGTVFLATSVPFIVMLVQLLRGQVVSINLEKALFSAITLQAVIVGVNNGVLPEHPNFWPLLAFIPLASILLKPVRSSALIWVILGVIAVLSVVVEAQQNFNLYTLNALETAPFERVGFVAILASLLLFFLDLAFRRHAVEYRREIHKIATEAQKAEGRFLANLSHEIRNPLNGVIGALDAIYHDKDPSAIRTNAGMALRVANQLTHIINDVLDIKRIELGQVTLAHSGFDIQEVLRSVYAVGFAQIGDKPISLVQNTALSDLPRFLIGDEARITQILLNITSNAIKFTVEGKVTIDVHYEYAASSLQITVKDTGIGMDEPTLNLIFDRFKQADNGSLTRSGSNGLGMALTKELTELMGGRIRIQSQEGVGTEVWLEIPLEIDSDKLARYHAGELDELASRRKTVSLKEMRILCVDDSRLNLMVTQFPLKRAGAQVSTCESAVEALEMLHAYHYDLLITDILMPIMDGQELLAAVRQFLPELPVVALTANVMPEDVRRYELAGFDRVLGKPIAPKVLLDEVLSFHPDEQIDESAPGRHVTG